MNLMLKIRLTEYLQSLWLPVWEDRELMVQAFTHKSYSADAPHENIPHNERLEFLGDSILWSIVASKLYHDNPKKAESYLTLMKIALVQEKTLAAVARDIGLGEMMLLWFGEEKSWWADKDSVLSDWLEAVLWYSYLVWWYEPVEKFIERTLYPYKDKWVVPVKSWKSKLQEHVQKTLKKLPVYEEFEETVEESWNVLVYRSEVSIEWKKVAEWVWASKKKAQDLAAQQAYLRLTTSE